MGRTGLIAVALFLLIGSVAAFTRTEKLKLEPAPISNPRFDRHFSPTCGCRRATAHLRFRLHGSERVDVSIVDADDNHVATLASRRELAAGPASFEWNGRGDDGRVAPDGTYRLKIRLEHDRRTILLPTTIRLDTVAPEARILSVQGGPGLDVRYSSNETGRAILLLDGKPVFRRHHRAGSEELRWPGPLPPGNHQVTLVVVDQAGNRSQPTMPVEVAG